MVSENVTKAKLRDYVELFTQLQSKVSTDEIALAMLQEIGKDVTRGSEPRPPSPIVDFSVGGVRVSMGD